VTNLTPEFRCPICKQPRSTVDELLAYQCGQCTSELIFTPRLKEPCAGVSLERGGPWRYSPLLPCNYDARLDNKASIESVRSPLLEQELDVGQVWLVDCSALATGTFKDLEAAVVVAMAAQLNLERIAVHSTGNTALAYRHFAMQVDLPCACYIPARNFDRKVRGLEANPRYPIFAVDAPYSRVSAIAKSHSVALGYWHLAPLAWKLEGKAALAYHIAEYCPGVDTIAQTIAGGYGPLGYEVGFRRLKEVGLGRRSVPASRRYVLFQPEDAATLARVWTTAETVALEPNDLMLPDDPYEPTLQSTNPLATLPRLRATLPAGSEILSVPLRAIKACENVIEQVLEEAHIALDISRERSTLIALAGLIEQARSGGGVIADRLAVIVSGAAGFESTSRTTPTATISS